jgi:hypothetical protein
MMFSFKLSRLSFVAILVAFVAVGTAHAVSVSQDTGSVPLLQPLSGAPSVPVIASGLPAATFIAYFNQSRSWIFQVAVGFTTVWVLIGGFLYMTSGNNQSRRTEAISRMTWAITGLIMLLFAGFILRTLNNLFFTP